MTPLGLYESSSCPDPPVFSDALWLVTNPAGALTRPVRFCGGDNHIFMRPVEWCQLKSPTHCRGGYHPPARAALFGTAPVEWYQPQAAAKTFPWGKVPRLAGAIEGGGMQEKTGKRGAKWYIVRIRRRICVK